jgi:hypothetical protein
MVRAAQLGGKRRRDGSGFTVYLGRIDPVTGPGLYVEERDAAGNVVMTRSITEGELRRFLTWREYRAAKKWLRDAPAILF